MNTIQNFLQINSAYLRTLPKDNRAGQKVVENGTTWILLDDYVAAAGPSEYNQAKIEAISFQTRYDYQAVWMVPIIVEYLGRDSKDLHFFFWATR